MSTKIIQVNPSDNVAVIVTGIEKGESVVVNDTSYTVLETIPFGHKMALCDIKAGQEITKYGFRIGVAKADITKGAWVHEHNVKTALEGAFGDSPELVELDASRFTGLEGLTFDGYRRSYGKVGVRNEIWIVPTVGCVNGTARELAREFNAQLDDDAIDGCFAYEHPYGCSQLGGDHERTQQVLAGLVRHPNAAAVLVLGLGCENNQVEDFKKVIGEYDEDRVKFLVTQDVEDEDLEAGKILEGLAEYASQFKREAVSITELKIGLKCGGSDAFSGITANPLVGVISEMVAGVGGSVALTEIPEIFGAENEFLPRCADRETCDKAVNMINGFRDYFVAHGEPVSENPSPGNRQGGITTLEEKSLGCVQKGGNVNIVDVLDYGQQISKPGLSVLNGPGNDIVAVTNLSAAGVHIILFTTGRGTPLGAPVPCMKVATNSDLATRKKNWIDFNAGKVLEGTSMDDAGHELLQQILDTASGKIQTKAEEHNFKDFAIFKGGVTL